MTEPDTRRVNAEWIEEIKRRHEEQKINKAKVKKAIEEHDDTKLRSLDSALKKTTAFMKKLKNIGAGAGPSLIDEMTKLNLSKFVEEMAQGIAEARFKLSDVPFVVDLCIEISCRYMKFSDCLVGELKKGLPLKKSDKVTNPSKLRVDMRLIVELFLSGVFMKEGLQAFGGALSYLVQMDKTEHVHVGLLSGLAQQIGWEMAGIVLKSGWGDIAIGDVPVSDSLTSDQRRTINGLFVDYCSGLVERTGKVCTEMNKVQKRVKKQERTRGDATQEDKGHLELMKNHFEKLKELSIELSESIGSVLEGWREEPSDDEEDELAAAQLSKALNEGELSLWDDEETKYFYENLIEIRRMVPSNLFKDSEESTMELDSDTVTDTIDDIDMEGLEGDEEEEGTTSSTPTRSISRDRSLSIPSSTVLMEEDYVMPEEITVADAESAAVMKKQMQIYISSLENLVNREAVDNAALDFVSNLNTAQNRRRLIRELVGLSLKHLDLHPFFARLIATLRPVMPDVATEISQVLIKQFREIVSRQGERMFLDNKIKNITLISELVKFGVVSRAEALNCLRLLVYDFRGHGVDMVCAMVESCGNYLYKNEDSHAKMKIILDVILKKKGRIKDPRQEMLIDNAYHIICPPEGGRIRAPLRPPMYEFVRHLIISLREESVDDSLKCLRRINWEDRELCDYTIHTLSSPWLLCFSQLCHLASALSGLSAIKHHEWTACEVVDNLLEIIRLSLESHNDSLNQKAISCVAYLGELYNYSVINSTIVFKVLYQLISFPEAPYDWSDFTRIRMTCQLLRTVGEFFQSGTGKKKMDHYLTYWHRFYWMKRTQWVTNASEGEVEAVFPPEVAGEMEDVTKYIRGTVSIPKSLEDAEREVEVLEEGFKEKVEQFLAGEHCDDVAKEEEGTYVRDRALHEIREEEEEDGGGESVMLSRRGSRVNEMMDEYEEENVHVKGNKVEILPEDEDFMRDLDKMMADSVKAPPAPAIATVTDLSLPAQAKQKFQRRICFSDQPSSARKSSSREEEETPKVALMTRGKGNKAVLKAVEMNEETLEKKWRENKEKERIEREHIKRVTLGLSKKMAEEEEYGDFPPLS